MRHCYINRLLLILCRNRRTVHILVEHRGISYAPEDPGVVPTSGAPLTLKAFNLLEDLLSILMRFLDVLLHIQFKYSLCVQSAQFESAHVVFTPF
jgi:hypothetical protein